MSRSHPYIRTNAQSSLSKAFQIAAQTSGIMSNFDALVKFTAKEDGLEYFAAVTAAVPNAWPLPPRIGSLVDAHHTLEQFQSGSNSKQVTVDKVSQHPNSSLESQAEADAASRSCWRRSLKLTSQFTVWA
jgi:hypothetical protein